jgi:hypothetical protein
MSCRDYTVDELLESAGTKLGLRPACLGRSGDLAIEGFELGDHLTETMSGDLGEILRTPVLEHGELGAKTRDRRRHRQTFGAGLIGSPFRELPLPLQEPSNPIQLHNRSNRQADRIL